MSKSPFVLIAAALANSFEGSASFQQPRLLSLRNQNVDRTLHNNLLSKLALEASRSVRENEIDFKGEYFPSSLGSSSFWMSGFSYHDDDYDDDEGMEDDLSYLPLNLLEEVPVGTEMLLRQVTDIYIKSDVDDVQDKIKLENVVETIDSEFKYTTVPVLLGNETLKVETRKGRQLKINDARTEASHIVSKILSFAAIHRLPAEIASLLFCNLSENHLGRKFVYPETLNEINVMMRAFENHGWKSVKFPEGLSLIVKRDCVNSRRNRYRPWPRKSLLTRSRDISEARNAVEEADQIQPPSKLIPKQKTMEEIDEFVNQLNTKSELSEKQYSIHDMLTFFPNTERYWSPFVREIKRRRTQILSAGRAGIVAYAMVAYCMYTISMICKWHLLSSSIEAQNPFYVQGKYDVIQKSLQKFFELFVSTYFSKPQLSKAQRLIMAGLLSPLGNLTLKMMQRRLKITANQAIGLISSIVVFLSLGLWCAIFFGYIFRSGANLMSLVM